MILSPHKEKPKVMVKVNGQILETQTKVKILGFVLDEKLLLDEHVKAIRSKTRSGLFALKLASKRGLNIRTLIQMANGLVCSHLHYCDIALSQAAKTTLDRLQARQDQVVRLIYKLAPWCDVDSHRRHLGWLDLDGKRNVHLATLIFRAQRNEAPAAICEFFRRAGDKPKKHRFNFRDYRTTDLEVPRWTKRRLQMTLQYRGAMFWNGLPNHIHRSKTADSCRQKTFNLLMKLSKKSI